MTKYMWKIAPDGLMHLCNVDRDNVCSTHDHEKKKKLILSIKDYIKVHFMCNDETSRLQWRETKKRHKRTRHVLTDNRASLACMSSMILLVWDCVCFCSFLVTGHTQMLLRSCNILFALIDEHSIAVASWFFVYSLFVDPIHVWAEYKLS